MLALNEISKGEMFGYLRNENYAFCFRQKTDDEEYIAIKFAQSWILQV